jgi:hypothetical protein
VEQLAQDRVEPLLLVIFLYAHRWEDSMDADEGKSPDAMHELAIALGRLAIAWGTMQDELGHLFSAVCFEQIDRVALACWHVHHNERSRRAMLIAAATAKLDTRNNPAF